jgi:hypothetical protein
MRNEMAKARPGKSTRSTAKARREIPPYRPRPELLFDPEKGLDPDATWLDLLLGRESKKARHARRAALKPE